MATVYPVFKLTGERQPQATGDSASFPNSILCEPPQPGSAAMTYA